MNMRTAEYTNPPSRAEAEKDLEALAAANGWVKH